MDDNISKLIFAFILFLMGIVIALTCLLYFEPHCMVNGVEHVCIQLN